MRFPHPISTVSTFVMLALPLGVTYVVDSIDHIKNLSLLVSNIIVVCDVSRLSALSSKLMISHRQQFGLPEIWFANGAINIHHNQFCRVGAVSSHEVRFKEIRAVFFILLRLSSSCNITPATVYAAICLTSVHYYNA